MNTTLRRAALGAALVLTPLAARPALAQQPAAPAIGAALVNEPEVGDRVPNFQLRWGDRTGTSDPLYDYSLQRDRGNVVVLVFYPQDWTPSGQAMLTTLAARSSELFGPGVIVMGVAPDSPEEHHRYASRLDVPFRLLSDPGLKVASTFGVALPFGQNQRAVYVVGRDGLVAYRDMRFDPKDPKSYTALGRAVRAAQSAETARSY